MTEVKSGIHNEVVFAIQGGSAEIANTGKIAVMQRQFGHKNADYSLQHARVTSEELGEVVDDRG